MVGRAALAVAEDMGELPDSREPGGQQLLHREFGRGMEIAPGRPTVARVVKLGRERLQMWLEPRAHLQCRGVDLDKPALGEEAANGVQDAPALCEPRTSQREAIGPPPFLDHSVLVLPGPPPYVRFCVKASLPEIL